MVLSTETVNTICCSVQKKAKVELQSQWNKLNKFRINGVFCDVEIQSQHKKHPAHKCVLSTASLYLEALFTFPSSDCEDIVDLTDFSAESVDFLLDVIYGVSSSQTIDLRELLRLAEFIQFNSFVDNLIDSLRIYMKTDECYEWYLIGKTCGITKLVILAKSYMMSNYESVRKVEKYQESLPLIEEIVSVMEPEFKTEVVIGFGDTYDVLDENPDYCGFYEISLDRMTKINIENKTVKDIYNGLNTFDIGFYPLENDPINSLRICSFFLFQFELISVSVSVDDTENSCRRIHFRKCDQMVEDVGAASRPIQMIKIDEILKDVVFGDDLATLFRPLSITNLFLESNFYNGIDSLYLSFRHVNKELVVIFKFDLKSLCVSKNWIAIMREKNDKVFPCTQTMVALVQTKLYGTVLVDNNGGLYDIESFDFEGTTMNHTPEPLGFRMGRLCKKVRREVTLPHRIESFTSFCCNGEELYLVSSGCYNEQSIDIHRSDAKNEIWLKCSTVNVDYKPRINQSFIYQENMYVIVQDMGTVPVTEKYGLTSIGNTNSSDQADNGKALYQELFRFNISTNALIKVDMQMPRNPTFQLFQPIFWFNSD